MGVLIKGMEMPKPKLADMATVYYAYILVSPNGHAAIVVDNEDGLDSTEYPLVPVPPHGDLIDRTALRRSRMMLEFDKVDGDKTEHVKQEFYWADVVNEAPVVIPGG